MNLTEVSTLADTRGCILKTMLTNNTSFYWVENHHFIGKPYNCLNDLAEFIQKLPLFESEPLAFNLLQIR
jgi:hypothetical protein